MERVETETLGDAIDESAATAATAAAPVVSPIELIIATAAAHDRPLYVTGPAGSGKFRAAEAIHRAAPRPGRPLFVVDCRGGPGEVFAVDDGVPLEPMASLSAVFAAARGGTVVFRSLGELDLRRQGELVHVLDADASRRRRARVIATDSRDLSSVVRLGALREELRPHFAADEARIPALRDRSGEIPQLVAELLREMPARDGRMPFVTARAMHLLQTFSWPGDVVELRHVVGALCARSADGCLTSDDVERALAGRADDAWIGTVPGVTFAEAERAVIFATLRGCGGSITQTAIDLGLSRRTVQYRLREFAGLAGRRQVRNRRR